MSAYDEYIRSVLSGGIVTSGKIAKLCRILESRGDRYKGWHFDVEAAERPVRFIETFCCLPDGKPGTLMKLEPFQKFFVEAIFGWVDDDGARQFQEVLEVIGRKNAKTTLDAAIQQYMLVADGEYGPQIYDCAVTEPQAALCYGATKKMMKQSPALSSRERMGLAPERKRQGILNDGPKGNDGYITTLSMDMPLDGLNVHCAILDELAAWKTRGPYDDIKQGTSSRRSPLIIESTTAGFVRNSIYDAQYDYASRWLDGEIEDDRFIAFVWELDRTDDWHDESLWPKANPGLGTIKNIDTLRALVTKADNDPSFLPTLLTKEFNIPQNSSSAWLTWDECGTDEELDFFNLGFRYCVIGFDYAEQVDLTCAQVMCIDGTRDADGNLVDDRIYEHSMYWIPEAKLLEREQAGFRDTKDHVPYRLWEDKGLLRVVPGNYVPVRVIIDYITELRDQHGLYCFVFGYDPWHIQGTGERQVIEQMVGKPRCEQVIQGAKTLSDPMKRLRADYQRHRIVDGGNPINRWCRMNVMVLTDSNLNVMPDKKEGRSANRIDGFMAELDAYIALDRHYDEYLAMTR